MILGEMHVGKDVSYCGQCVCHFMIAATWRNTANVAQVKISHERNVNNRF
jgi:hypothetical protein